MCVSLNLLAIVVTVSSGVKAIKWVQFWGREVKEQYGVDEEKCITCNIVERTSECTGKRSDSKIVISGKMWKIV